MWMQSVAGVGYLFGSLSPAIKSSLGYNQRQVASHSVGFLAGTLCAVLPLWAALLIGAAQNLVGYGWVWLAVTHRVPVPPLWAMCMLIFVGNNGETYFNTAALVSCVQNFPKNRGPIVGILKVMVAVGPTMVVIALMFIVRPVNGHRQVRPSDGTSFTFVYSVCLVLAAYVGLSHSLTILCTIILMVLLLVPIVIPVMLSFFSNDDESAYTALLTSPRREEASGSVSSEEQEVILSEVDEQKPKEIDLLPASERQKRIAELQAKLFQAAAVGAVRVKRRKGPRRGEDFTLLQAMIKADFWLLFFSLLLGSGSGLTVIDNLGQMSQSLGFEDSHIFVSMISIWNFLGRISGGFFSEYFV
ncbi:unnamed protein product [Triticum turgidum subsp. durum]|uniref:Nodulin-like domain-containing protein n=1 Tax=Triticum turgidum subsp. durum TaxID=4567 RepID=A0A9R0ZAQ9_TRITD|nr:unnamed protein product [Triticum turgidum subsp. durum]